MKISYLCQSLPKLSLMLFCVFILNNASAKDLKLAVGLALPPYFIQENQEGMELNIIQESLKPFNINVKAVFLPLARVNKAFNDKLVDCASPVNENSNLKAFFSAEHITYQNFAITLKSNNLRVNNVNDLSKLRVIAFQNASLYLGPAYNRVVSNNKKYMEKANQSVQNKLLFRNRADVVVADINIFKYFTKKVADVVNTSQPVVYHDLFPKSPYKVAFQNRQDRDNFNKGLKRLKMSGRYDEIISSYIK